MEYSIKILSIKKSPLWDNFICKLFNLFKIKYLWRILSAFKVNVLLYSFILNLNILLVFNIGVKTVIDLEDTEIDISNFESLEYFYIYTPSVTLDYLYGFDLQSCIFELYI